MMILFIVAYRYSVFDYDKRISYKHPALLSGLFLLSLSVVYFPYLLGLRVQSLGFNVENRALFVEDMTIYFLATIWVFYMAGFIRRKHPQFVIREGHYYVIAVMCCSFVLFIYGHDLQNEFTIPYIVSTIADGSARDFVDYQERILDEISESDEDDITITYNLERYPIRNQMIIGLWLSDDPNRWDYYNNQTVAAYYGKDRVDVEYIYE